MRRLKHTVLLKTKNGGREPVPAGTPESDPRTKGITNPHAWADDGMVDATPAPAGPTAAEKAAAKKAAAAERAAAKKAAAAAGAEPTGDGKGDGGTPPPPAERPAEDADAEAWAAYAAALGQDVPVGADKDAIVAQLDAAGLLSE